MAIKFLNTVAVDTDVLYVDASSNNVGIGTTSPNRSLHVIGQIALDNSASSPSAGMLISVDSASNKIYSRTANNNSTPLPFEIISGSSSSLYINSSGNVGIGTTSPSHKLDIYSNENVPLRIHRPSNANLDSSGAWGIGFSTRGDAVTSTTDTRAGIFSYYNGNLFLAAANTSIVADPDAYARLTILNSGNVGIGTASPSYKLHVDSNEANADVMYVHHDNPSQSSGNVMKIRSDAGDNAGSALLNIENNTGTGLYVRGDRKVGIGTTNPSEKLDVAGNIKMTETAATTDTDKIVVSDSGVLKYRTGAQILSDIGGQPSISAPNAPTNLSLTIVGNTVDVTFTASTTSDIDAYLIYSSVDGSDYGLISIIPPDDFSATMSIIDDAFSVSGTQAYRVYAMKLGNMSSALTGSISYTVSTPLEPTNMSVVPLNTAYFVQWDPPSSNARFVTAYNVYKHEDSSQANLARASATLVYSGMNTNYMYQISGANNTNYHQFWVETTVA